MELIQDARCYTDVCVKGKWFHYDHCTTNAYMLNGGESSNIELAKMPSTENELVDLLSDMM
ncbi:hypothetical protein BCU68_03460 [Vibrio sp. 10N.286.49.B3]|uniref:hypothetical protein n=1 Tax=Vibrio sp. 10N.286.49.B3 TaxID=1880855 RepID=UPI000C8444C7|nr:hypothetical protein [Vibrio sp. 10N.286.49.B3]PMH44569.1 hypothetical protein BCU68_03460 [Vibrio sp. 10N.286.49.B3]